MPDGFVHLHVASGFSLQYGASHPQALVERAVEQEMDALALTDRNGTYGAVRFAKACQRAAIRFYQRYGFGFCGPFEPYSTMPPENIATSIFMEKSLI